MCVCVCLRIYKHRYKLYACMSLWVVYKTNLSVSVTSNRLTCQTIKGK